MASTKLFVCFLSLLHKSRGEDRPSPPPLWQQGMKRQDQIQSGTDSILRSGFSWCQNGVGLWVFTSTRADCFAKPQRRACQSLSWVAKVLACSEVIGGTACLQDLTIAPQALCSGHSAVIKTEKKVHRVPWSPHLLSVVRPSLPLLTLYLGESHTGRYNVKAGLYNTLALSLMVYRFGACILRVVSPERSTPERPCCTSAPLSPLPASLLHPLLSLLHHLLPPSPLLLPFPLHPLLLYPFSTPPFPSTPSPFLPSSSPPSQSLASNFFLFPPFCFKCRPELFIVSWG